MKNLTPMNVKRFVTNKIAIADFPLLHSFYVISSSGNEPTPEYKAKIENDMASKGYTPKRFNEIIDVFENARISVSHKIAGGTCKGTETVWKYVMDKIDACSPNWC